MIKIVTAILGGLVAALGCAAAALLGGGVAAADDSVDGVVGETYAHAKSALRKQGKAAVVASTVGDRVDWNDCLVVSATPASTIDGFGKKHRGRPEVNVALNCYATFSTSSSPGFSLQSPEGQKLYQEALSAYQAKKAQAALAEG